MRPEKQMWNLLLLKLIDDSACDSREDVSRGKNGSNVPVATCHQEINLWTLNLPVFLLFLYPCCCWVGLLRESVLFIKDEHGPNLLCSGLRPLCLQATQRARPAWELTAFAARPLCQIKRLNSTFTVCYLQLLILFFLIY